MSNLIRKIVIFLVRKRLGLKLHQPFRFANQRHVCDYYYFTPETLKKYRDIDGVRYPSSVSLNHLLSDECKNNIILVEDN